jgi:hypothetical protein
MKILCLIDVVSSILLSTATWGAEKVGCSCGQERMEIPATFDLPVQSDQESLAMGWKAAPQVRRRIGADWPFRDNVEIGFGGRGHMIVLREKSVYACPKWNNIGYFLKEVSTAHHFQTILSLLHENWTKECLSVAQFNRVLQAVRSADKTVPLRTRTTDIDEESVRKRCFVQDNVWVADFLVIEGASVIEYKYAVNDRNRIARIRKEVIQGPSSPVAGLNGFINVPSPEMVEYHKWRGFLLGAARVPELRIALGDRDKSIRCASAFALRDIGEAAKDAVPDLLKLLGEADEEVRHAAELALRAIGASAMSQLREALNDHDPDVRKAAEKAIKAIEQ